ncbi:hypothetical protein F5Y16DRAFT_370407 [Xylariaceae sp. FL0255]|nr:hypothetical protein F5Y16DRAFT_370407 [Xylariaceae sp. FL0255]
MIEVNKYYIPPKITPLIPNSPKPLLHYPGAFKSGPATAAVDAYDKFSQNGWEVQWIFRYGKTQPSYFHSSAHECMAVLSGHATVRFGVADAIHASNDDAGSEDGGLEIEAQAGDVFVIPAGVAHKTFNAKPENEFKLLTSRDGYGVAGDDVRTALAEVELSGFTMIGAYPQGCARWDFIEYERDATKHPATWSVEIPDCDPLLGTAAEGLRRLWQGQ